MARPVPLAQVCVKAWRAFAASSLAAMSLRSRKVEAYEARKNRTTPPSAASSAGRYSPPEWANSLRAVESKSEDKQDPLRRARDHWGQRRRYVFPGSDATQERSRRTPVSCRSRDGEFSYCHTSSLKLQ